VRLPEHIKETAKKNWLYRLNYAV